MRAEIAVGGSHHVKNITRPCAKSFPHADVVFEDLAGGGGHVCAAVEEAFDNGVSQR